ncbi:hypothetical protein [Actinophytocola glycyrrhizae]|uniref:Uncharacterized protein n=1 Tax=Actinophytocola glycyrrhizae TaxID=2044873 RepID=A0ABV9RT91_9PSEU
MTTTTGPTTGPTVLHRLYAARRWLWLAAAVPAAVLAGLIMVVLPPDQTLDNLAEWLFKLSPFLFAVAAVAVFPRGRFGPALVVLGVLVYMGYLDTALILRILEYRADGQFSVVYQFQLFVVTYIVLFGLLAFRLGGARAATVLKVGAACVLIVISGLNDLGFWVMNDWGAAGRPSTLEWASHIIVFTGGPPSVPTAVVFLLIHFALAAAVLAAPVERWVDRRLGR